jgi:hypothetical protein
MSHIVHVILYIKTTVLFCLFVWAVFRHCLDRPTDTTVVCFVEGGGGEEVEEFLDLGILISVTVITQLTVDGPGTGEVQVQASNGWMVRQRVNHSDPVWSDEIRCLGIQWMDGALAGVESLWPSVIRWKPWDETGISWMGWNCPLGVSLLGQ